MPKPKVDFDHALNTKIAIEEVATLTPDQFKSFVNAAKAFIKANEPSCGFVPRQWKKDEWKTIATKFVNERGASIWSGDRAGITSNSFRLPDDRDKLTFLSFCMLKFECGTYYKKKRANDELADAETAKEAAKPPPPPATQAKKRKIKPAKASPEPEISPARSAYVSEGTDAESRRTPALADPFKAIRTAESRNRASVSMGRSSTDGSLSPKKPTVASLGNSFHMPTHHPPHTPTKSKAVEEFRRSASRKSQQTAFEAAVEISHPSGGTSRRENPVAGRVFGGEKQNEYKDGRSSGSLSGKVRDGEVNDEHDDDDDDDDNDGDDEHMGDDAIEEDGQPAANSKDKDVVMSEADDEPLPTDSITLKHNFGPKQEGKPTERSVFNSSASSAVGFGDKDPFNNNGKETLAENGHPAARASAAQIASSKTTNKNIGGSTASSHKTVDDTPIPFSTPARTNGNTRRNALTSPSQVTAALSRANNSGGDFPPVTAREVRSSNDVGRDVKPKPNPGLGPRASGGAKVDGLNSTNTNGMTNVLGANDQLANGGNFNGNVKLERQSNAANISSSVTLTPTTTILFNIRIPTDPPPRPSMVTSPVQVEQTTAATTTTTNSKPNQHPKATQHSPSLNSPDYPFHPSPPPNTPTTHLLPLPLNIRFQEFYGTLLLSPAIASSTPAKRRLVSCRQCRATVPRIGSTRAKRWMIDVFGLGVERVWESVLTRVARAVRDELLRREGMTGDCGEDGKSGEQEWGELEEVEVELDFEYDGA